MKRLSITCPYCNHTDNTWPSNCFAQGKHERYCGKCYSVFIAVRTNDTVTTRQFTENETSKYPYPNKP